jgi:hypothetical protein
MATKPQVKFPTEAPNASRKDVGKTSTTSFSQLKRHYDLAKDETDKRTTGRGRIGSISFNEADELFRSWINESKWPYDALLFDPRVFTFIFEKTSRLFANRLRGRLIPRDGGDVLGAHINNELLDFQWDQATQGGSMLAKWAMMDLNTRKYGASFGLCKWRYEKADGKIIFDGPEMKVLNNRDCLPDPTATSIESCNWFQVRELVTFQDLKSINDQRSVPIYQNLDVLQAALGNEATAGGDTRGTNWQSRNREISHLTVDPFGRDQVYPRVELVTEYRRDRWVTFSPKHGVIIRDIKNPYGNYELPITMLRYYQIDDDLYGLSEIEPVKSLQKAINALVSQYVDEINQKLYSPIAIGPSVKQYTLEWGKGARWQMQNPMSDFRVVESSANAIQFFNNTYSALVSAMMNAIGESSLGVSNLGNFQKDKTATEVQEVVKQRNARDSFNQNFLAEAIERQMMLWHKMNQEMLFSDKEKTTYIIRVVGKDAIEYFQNRGLNKYGPSDEATQLVMKNPDLNLNIQNLETPLHPVQVGNGEDSIVPKFNMNDGMDSGSLVVEPEDVRGNYDYVADVQSMALGAGDSERVARDQAMKTLLTSPVAIQLLEKEDVKPKFKELFIAWLQDSGFKDAEKFFEAAPQSSSIAQMQGMLQKTAPPQKTPTVSINYKDLPPNEQSAAAQQAGLGGTTSPMPTTGAQTGQISQPMQNIGQPPMQAGIGGINGQSAS